MRLFLIRISLLKKPNFKSHKLIYLIKVSNIHFLTFYETANVHFGYARVYDLSSVIFKIITFF
ncbi:hypothetical protein LV84_02131 [Algoriphagus ratkowskyi]|uniref:Uncharacterized protein n=1 Tax=Algoriphagus ratkowskyi TaxID=57028 RepID=A0A2W7RF35_9BACT|nr:hypothetical protein LV84_02131 [Algoriphagus ratkowskyi]